jgi:hypothetical protein
MRALYALTVAVLFALTSREGMADTIVNHEFSPDAALTVSASEGWVQYLSGGFRYGVTTGRMTSSTVYGTGWFGPFTNSVLLGCATDSITVGYRVGQSVIIDFVDLPGSAWTAYRGAARRSNTAWNRSPNPPTRTPSPSTRHWPYLVSGSSAFAWFAAIGLLPGLAPSVN